MKKRFDKINTTEVSQEAIQSLMFDVLRKNYEEGYTLPTRDAIANIEDSYLQILDLSYQNTLIENGVSLTKQMTDYYCEHGKPMDAETKAAFQDRLFDKQEAINDEIFGLMVNLNNTFKEYGYSCQFDIVEMPGNALDEGSKMLREAAGLDVDNDKDIMRSFRNSSIDEDTYEDNRMKNAGTHAKERTTDAALNGAINYIDMRREKITATIDDVNAEIVEIDNTLKYSIGDKVKEALEEAESDAADASDDLDL